MRAFLAAIFVCLAASPAAATTYNNFMPVICTPAGASCGQATPVANPDGTFVGSAVPAGSATAANQTAVQSAPGTSATTAITVQGSASGVGLPVSTADGANVALGAKADSAWTTGSGSLVSVLKAIDRDTLLPLAAGNAIVGSVYSRTARVTATPTVTASSAYTAGNELGGLLTYSNAFGTQQSGVIQSVRAVCKSVQTTGLKVYFFTTNPTNSTWADKTTPAINAADVGYALGPFTLSSPDSGLGTITTWTLDGIGAAIVASSTTLYAAAVVTGTPTFASTSDCTVTVTVLQD